MHAGGSDFRLYDGSDFKDFSFGEMVGARCFGCCQAHWGLPVGFLLLWYSALCSGEFLSLLCFISFLYVLYNAWISKGSFMQTKHQYVLAHI